MSDDWRTPNIQEAIKPERKSFFECTKRFSSIIYRKCVAIAHITVTDTLIEKEQWLKAMNFKVLILRNSHYQITKRAIILFA